MNESQKTQQGAGQGARRSDIIGYTEESEMESDIYFPFIATDGKNEAKIYCLLYVTIRGGTNSSFPMPVRRLSRRQGRALQSDVWQEEEIECMYVETKGGSGCM